MRSRIGPLWRIYYPKEFAVSIKVLNNFIEPFVERAIRQSRSAIEEKELAGGKVNFTDSLSQFTTDRAVLRDQLVSTLLAGRGAKTRGQRAWVNVRYDSMCVVLVVL